MFGDKVGHLGRVGSLTLAQRVSAMFSRGEPGAWYDPSDMSTLWQDSAGTVPVTAVEQPVGRILDKSGRGNHATQVTTTKRPVLSRRVNLFTQTENVSGAAWNANLFGNWTINGARSAAAAPSPRGDFTATTISFTSPLISVCVGQRAAVSPGIYRVSLWLRLTPGVSSPGSAFINIGVVNGNANAWVAPFSNVQNIGPQLDESWKMFTIDHTVPPSGVNQIELLINKGSSADSCSVDVWGASLTLATDAHLPYQWVNTPTDYDADPAKFPAYRSLDGVDDSHASATGGGGNAGFFFSAAVTPQGGAGTARTLFSDAGTNTGYIVRLNTSNQLELSAGNGTTYTTIATAGTLAVGSTDIVQAWDDGTNLNVKIGNGATASIARPTVSAGTAGYTMGQDNGASTGYFNGRAYSTIYRKDSGLTQVQREAVALYQRQKARMP
mgnify:CR=1 FL=1